MVVYLESLIDASQASTYQCDINCTDMHNVQAGAWEQAGTWYCNRVPKASDTIIITTGTIVTLGANVQATAFTIENNGTISFGTGATLYLIKP